MTSESVRISSIRIDSCGSDLPLGSFARLGSASGVSDIAAGGVGVPRHRFVLGRSGQWHIPSSAAASFSSAPSFHLRPSRWLVLHTRSPMSPSSMVGPAAPGPPWFHAGGPKTTSNHRGGDGAGAVRAGSRGPTQRCAVATRESESRRRDSEGRTLRRYAAHAEVSPSDCRRARSEGSGGAHGPVPVPSSWALPGPSATARAGALPSP